MALRGQDVVGKAAVIRQQHEAGAGLVQPPGREQFPPGVGVAQQVHDGGVPLVGGGADHTFGLVQHDVDELLVRQRSPFHGHHIRLPELGVPFFAERAVHGHFSLLQQNLRLAPGALGRLGQIFIQSHGFSLSPLSAIAPRCQLSQRESLWQTGKACTERRWPDLL